MIGRLYNKMRQEQKREEERECSRPQEERMRANIEQREAMRALLESEAPWRNTRRVKCACGNTARFDIPNFPITFACSKCGSRQTLLR